MKKYSSLMLLIIASNLEPLQLINLDLLNTELIQELCGSTDIVLTVPLTALITVYLVSAKSVIPPKSSPG